MIVKITLIACFTMLSAVFLHAQFIVNEYGDPQPFSLNSPYKEIIQPETVEPHFTTAAYNNDSLFRLFNPPEAEHLKYNCRKVQMAIDSTHSNFKELATHFDLGHGDLWLYKITSPTSEGIAVVFKKFEVPEGALFSYFRLKQSGDYTFVYESQIGNDDFSTIKGLYVQGKELYIEYYEPKGIKQPLEIVVEQIAYSFKSGFDRSLPDDYKKTRNQCVH
jgi:hypothetical protein